MRRTNGTHKNTKEMAIFLTPSTFASYEECARECVRCRRLSATPTGIEAIAEGSLLYTVKGAIVIVPTAPIEVMILSANGRPIFHDEVAGYTQITAKAGIYVVVIQKGKDRLIEKVIVK